MVPAAQVYELRPVLFNQFDHEIFILLRAEPGLQRIPSVSYSPGRFSATHPVDKSTPE
jgi:hypothetical protein